MGEIARRLSVRPGEGRAVLFAFGYVFCLLAAYYVLRPVRDALGVEGGAGLLPKLYVWTFAVSLGLAPLYGLLVSRLKRRIFVPLVYGFLLLNMLVFWGLLSARLFPGRTEWGLYVWISVFPVFAISVFWSFMADLFSPEQAVRLYPLIAAGGGLGGLAGSALVTITVQALGVENLILAAAILLALGMTLAMRLDRAVIEGEAPQNQASQGEALFDPVVVAETTVGGAWHDGFTALLGSPYLQGLCLWVVMLSLAGALAYFHQVSILGAAHLSDDDRTAFFGRIDLIASLLILILPLTFTRWALKRLGIGPTLAVLALVLGVGFVLLALAPSLTGLICFQVLQRVSQFAVSNPARETLWPLTSRSDRYKAKIVIDNVIFRGADVIAVLVMASLSGMGLSSLSLILAALMIPWGLLSLWLGRRRAELDGDRSGRAPAWPPAATLPG